MLSKRIFAFAFAIAFAFACACVLCMCVCVSAVCACVCVQTLEIYIFTRLFQLQFIFTDKLPALSQKPSQAKRSLPQLSKSTNNS